MKRIRLNERLAIAFQMAGRGENFLDSIQVACYNLTSWLEIQLVRLLERERCPSLEVNEEEECTMQKAHARQF